LGDSPSIGAVAQPANIPINIIAKIIFKKIFFMIVSPSETHRVWMRQAKSTLLRRIVGSLEILRITMKKQQGDNKNGMGGPERA